MTAPRPTSGTSGGGPHHTSGKPGQPNEHGVLEVGGWVWREDLRTAGDGTEVTLTYDWSRTPAEQRAEIGGMPPFGPELIEESLAALERAVTAPAH